MRASATPPGSKVVVGDRDRWYRFAQPPANFCDPSGIEKPARPQKIWLHPSNQEMNVAELERPIRYACPRCKSSMRSFASDAGSVTACPECGQKLRVPPLPASEGIAPADASRSWRLSAQPPPLPVTKLEPEPDERDCCGECGRDIGKRGYGRRCRDCKAPLCSRECFEQHNEFAHVSGRAAHSEGKEMAVTGLILGSIGFMLAFLPCFGWLLAIKLGIFGAICSGVGLARTGRRQGKGLAIAGLSYLRGDVGARYFTFW